MREPEQKSGETGRGRGQISLKWPPGTSEDTGCPLSLNLQYLRGGLPSSRGAAVDGNGYLSSATVSGEAGKPVLTGAVLSVELVVAGVGTSWQRSQGLRAPGLAKGKVGLPPRFPPYPPSPLPTPSVETIGRCRFKSRHSPHPPAEAPSVGVCGGAELSLPVNQGRWPRPRRSLPRPTAPSPESRELGAPLPLSLPPHARRGNGSAA